MTGSDLPFPNGMRNDSNNSFGFRIGRRKRSIFLLILFCLFFVIWFNSDINTTADIQLPDDVVSRPEVVSHKEEEEEENLEQSEQEQAIQEEIKDDEHQQEKLLVTATMAKLVPQHYKYFVVVGSRASQASRRSLIRETYFGIEDNIEPCMKRDKGVGYLFYIYGEEPTPKTPERRSYETEKIEYNDLEKINTDKFDQDQVLKWADDVLTKRGVTFDYLIVQDGYSIIQLGSIIQQLETESTHLSQLEKSNSDIMWVSSKNPHLVVAGHDALKRVLDKAETVKIEEEMTLPSQYYEFYRSLMIQLNFVSESEEVERLQSMIKEAPLFIDDKNRFQLWNNAVEKLPDTTIAVSNVYQDKDFSNIAERLSMAVVPLCNPLNNPHIAVLTSSFIYADSCMEPSASLAADNKREYAMKHNYAFIGRSNEFAQQALRTVKRRTVWGKVDAVQKVLPKYDWIFWMDMDAVIMDQSQTVQGILDNLRNSYEGGPREFEKNIDLVIAKPNRDKMINAGVFFLRNTEWAQTFLNKVQETKEWFNRGPSYEQGAMWDTIQLPGFKEHVLLLDNDDHTFNTFPSLYVPGDFIVHFAPDKCPNPAVLSGLEATKRIEQGQVVTSFSDE